MTIARYEIFKKVAEIGNFTKAAEQLNMTQSAVSHAITSLEKEIGHSLLKRSKQAGIATTPIAERLLPHISQLLRSESIIRQEISLANQQLEGTLRIGAFTSAASQLLPPMLAQVKQLHTGIKVVLFEGTYDEIKEWLLQGTIDLGFVVPSNPHSRLNLIPLLQDELVIGLPSEHRLTRQERIDIHELNGQDFIMPKGSYYSLVEECLASHGITPNITMEVLHCETIINMVSQGLGLTMGPELLFRAYPQIEHKRLLQKSCRLISLAYLEASPVIQAFLSCNKLI